MKLSLSLFAILAAIAAPRALPAGAPPLPVAPLFDSRAPLAPLMAKLREVGGDPARIVRPKNVGELASLKSGARYKFVLARDGRLAIAPSPDDPANPYTHPILAGGEPVRTAGGIRVQRSGGAITKVIVDPDSRAYCPTADSLREALDALAALGVAGDALRVENRPVNCYAVGGSVSASETPMMQAPSAAPVRFGALMVEVGHHFELIGAAGKAQRFDLAAYELHELSELFDEIPNAEPPKDTHDTNVAGLADAFGRTSIPELTVAVRAHDEAEFAKAYANAALTCNGCHQSTGRGFIEVPAAPGEHVPRVDPAH
jgi:hypothetical protein